MTLVRVHSTHKLFMGTGVIGAFCGRIMFERLWPVAPASTRNPSIQRSHTPPSLTLTATHFSTYRELQDGGSKQDHNRKVSPSGFYDFAFPIRLPSRSIEIRTIQTPSRTVHRSTVLNPTRDTLLGWELDWNQDLEESRRSKS